MSKLSHPRFSRRTAVQAGAVGILGMSSAHLARLNAESEREPKAKNVIYIFLSGGLAQQDSFDMKPGAPDNIRGEFQPIATRTTGTHICEHLPRLANLSQKWSLVRSLTHPFQEHSQGHMVMLSGRTDLPTGFDFNKPKPTDHPSIASIAGQLTHTTNNLPPAIVLPEKLVHRTGRVLPGQFGGQMGAQHDPYFLNCCQFNAASYGAWPAFGFHHQRGKENPKNFQFMPPSLKLPQGVSQGKFAERSNLMKQFDEQKRNLEKLAEVEPFDRFQERAISLMTDRGMKKVFDINSADEKTQERYGKHTFGWSCLLAKRLIESGVNLVQVNLGNNETWDTHGNAFPHLKNYLFPPMDQAVSALINDLDESGLLESTLIVMGSEFGRTPKIFRIPSAYALPGRDHWGKVQTVLLAGGGIQGGRIVGSSDAHGGSPKDDPQKPENLAATIYQALGLPKSATWHDLIDRPMPIYNGSPIKGLT